MKLQKKYKKKMEISRISSDLKFINQIGRTLNLDERFGLFYYFLIEIMHMIIFLE